MKEIVRRPMSLPEIEMIPLNKIRDNMWRDKKRNPINPEKVEQIAESIISTGEFWIGVYGRKLAGGFVELAFGHHRADAAKAVDTGDVIEAAKSAGLKSIPVAIGEFTDGEMLMRMARENLRGELPVVLEVVSAAVRALGEGKIEVPAPGKDTPKTHIRFAPSFVPGRPSGSEPERPYTASTLAFFLGGIYITKDRGMNAPSNSVKAALGILELEEKKIQGITPRTFENKPIREIIPMVADIKKRVEVVQERRGKSAAEIAELGAKRREAEAKAKADEKAAEEAHKALVKKLADAQREERMKAAEKLAAQLKENDQRAKEKEVLNKLRMSQLEEQLAAKKEWEAKQRIQDEYLPIRRDVEAFISKYETKASERNPEREEIKSLAGRKGLRPEDRARASKALREYANWLYDWALPQLALELKAEQKRKAEARKVSELRPKGKGGA